MVKAEQAAGRLRVAATEIWKHAIARKQARRERRRTPVRRWEAWYLGDDGTCGNCGVAAANAGQLGACPTCGYEGKEISVG